jgi:hypothetical protein
VLSSTLVGVRRLSAQPSDGARAPSLVRFWSSAGASAIATKTAVIQAVNDTGDRPTRPINLRLPPAHLDMQRGKQLSPPTRQRDVNVATPR